MSRWSYWEPRLVTFYESLWLMETILLLSGWLCLFVHFRVLWPSHEQDNHLWHLLLVLWLYNGLWQCKFCTGCHRYQDGTPRVLHETTPLCVLGLVLQAGFWYFLPPSSHNPLRPLWLSLHCLYATLKGFWCVLWQVFLCWLTQ